MSQTASRAECKGRVPMAMTLCCRNSSSSGRDVDGVMMVYGCNDVRLNLLMCLITRSSCAASGTGQWDGENGRTGEACPASHFSFNAATSRYPSGFLFRSRTLMQFSSFLCYEFKDGGVRDVREVALVRRLYRPQDRLIRRQRKRRRELEVLKQRSQPLHVCAVHLCGVPRLQLPDTCLLERARTRSPETRSRSRRQPLLSDTSPRGC